jgi:hypothetical protein
LCCRSEGEYPLCAALRTHAEECCPTTEYVLESRPVKKVPTRTEYVVESGPAKKVPTRKHVRTRQKVEEDVLTLNQQLQLLSILIVLIAVVRVIGWHAKAASLWAIKKTWRVR